MDNDAIRREISRGSRLDGVFIRNLSKNATIKLVCKDCAYRDGHVITQSQKYSTKQPLPEHHCADCRNRIEWE